MSALKIQEYANVEVVDSQQIAEMIEKPHNDLMKSIRTYCEYLIEGDFSPNDFFVEHTYKDSIGRTLPCYLITKKGCDMIANKMTGQKGILFTAAYVTAFEKMWEQRHALENPAFTSKDYLKAARIVSRCPNKRLPIVLSLLESSGIDVEAVVAAGRAMALMEPAKPERYPHRRVYTTEQKTALADEAIELLWVCGLNNKQMAEKLGIPYNMIAKYRNGYRRPEPDRAEHIIKTLKDDMEIVEVEA